MNNMVVKAIQNSRNFLVILITTVGMLPELAAGGGYYIGGDITHQLLPFVYETKRMFSTGIPFWSWNTYFGDNFIASYAYYTVFNPFTWINCLFPYKYLGLGFTLVLYLKFLVCGYVAQAYLKKMGFGERLSLIGSLLYTFSSWAISNLLFYFFLEPMILFPFLLIFVERFLGKERHAYSGLAMATFVVVTVNYYFAAINLIAATIYFFCRLLFLYKERTDRTKTALNAFGCVFLGIACSSVVLIPVLHQIKGYADGPIDSDATDIHLWLDRLFWLIYPKAHEGRFFYIFLNSGWKSNTASIAVFGVLPTILLFTKKGNGWIKWLIGVLAVIYVTPLNGIFSLFTDYYYTRWAYALTLAIIVATLQYMKEYGLPKFKYAAWYCWVIYGAFFLIAAASYYWHYNKSGDLTPVMKKGLCMDAALIAANTLSLILICSRVKTKNIRFTASVSAVSFCAAFQFLTYSLPGVRTYSSEDSFITETDYFNQGIDFRSDDEFRYRTNFTPVSTGGRPSSNFGLICNRSSIETYHSVQNGKIHKWNSIVGDSLHRQRVFFPRKFVRSFEALMSVRDLAVLSFGDPDSTVLGKPKGETEIFTIYESDHYIPIGFAYDQYVLAEEVEETARFEKETDIPRALLSTLAIDRKDEKELRPYLKKGCIEVSLNLDSLVAERRAVTCDKFIGHSQGFDAHISLDTAKVIFFSVVADDGFKAYIDGEPTKIYETNLGFSSVIVPEGSHEVTFRYFTPGLKLGLIISVIGWCILGFIFHKRL